MLGTLLTDPVGVAEHRQRRLLRMVTPQPARTPAKRCPQVMSARHVRGRVSQPGLGQARRRGSARRPGQCSTLREPRPDLRRAGTSRTRWVQSSSVSNPPWTAQANSGSAVHRCPFRPAGWTAPVASLWTCVSTRDGRTSGRGSTSAAHARVRVRRQRLDSPRGHSRRALSGDCCQRRPKIDPFSTAEN